MPSHDPGWRAPAAALLAFAAITAAVVLHLVGGFDARAAELVRRAAPGADALARAVTALASGPVTAVVAAAAAALALRAGDRRAAAVIGAALALDVVAVELLKALVGRARPSFPYTALALRSHAFPSGHSANAVAVWGMLAVLAGRRFPVTRAAVLGAAAVFAILVGASRVYLGVHWPSDVLGGWAAGAAILAGLAAALLPGRAPGEVAGARPPGSPSRVS